MFSLLLKKLIYLNLDLDSSLKFLACVFFSQKSQNAPIVFTSSVLSSSDIEEIRLDLKKCSTF